MEFLEIPMTADQRLRIIGLLSTPKYVYQPLAPGPTGFLSNYVVAYIRALSGPAVEKAPQRNVLVKDLAFRYGCCPKSFPIELEQQLG